MIRKTNCKLDLVVVATCHSEFVGKIFQEAGAKHRSNDQESNLKFQDEINNSQSQRGLLGPNYNEEQRRSRYANYDQDGATYPSPKFSDKDSNNKNWRISQFSAESDDEQVVLKDD